MSLHGNAKPLEAKYGTLVVLSRSGRMALCQCDCGSAPREFWITNLRSGISTHCGCAPRGTHGMTHTGEYRSWQKLRDRCFNEKNDHYADYGGRGITVCERWRESFENFYADMGPKPTPKHTIERSDNNGPYAPENCKWATRAEQQRNRRNNVVLTAFGEAKVLMDWARDARCRVGLKGLQKRIRNGMAPELAISTPAQDTTQNLGVYLTKGRTNPFAVNGRPKNRRASHA